jgi:glycosyltransferase involved in cell wall biosynthesis
VRISVIIPAFNEERLLPDTLRYVKVALNSFTERGWDTELIVCDNNSTDRTAEIARNEGANVVFEPINQIGRARNRGAAAASGDWLIFVDADSKPNAELFRQVAEQIASGRCLAGGSTVTLDGHFPLGNLLVQLWNLLSRLGNWMAGSFIFCEAAAFRTVRGFSEELFVAEELALSKRFKELALQSGKRVVILHRHPLLTSGRKFHLYTFREHLALLLQTAFRPTKTFNTREGCHMWYDGRR